MLKTETNNVYIKLRVAKAAVATLDLDKRKMQLDFEHGQWWVTDKRTGAQWSVCDAEGPGSVDGFSFEQVTQGDA
jgi:hypothetical protein